jgi:hypothetical protein
MADLFLNFVFGIFLGGLKFWFYQFMSKRILCLKFKKYFIKDISNFFLIRF